MYEVLDEVKVRFADTGLQSVVITEVPEWGYDGIISTGAMKGVRVAFTGDMVVRAIKTGYRAF